MNILMKYGWYFLLLAIIGEMLVPFVLGRFYLGYSHSTMVISTLGSPGSPVRGAFNAWMLTAGILLLLSLPVVFHAFSAVSRPLSVLLVLLITVFAVGACVLSAFFCVNESKDVVSTASQIHGFGSAVGFMFFLFVPLVLGILFLKTGARADGLLSLICFGLALLFFVPFVMADKPQFQGTLIGREGLWQRLNLLFMYLPLAWLAVKNSW